MYVSVCLCVCLCVPVCLSLATSRPLDLSRPVLASLCLSESKPITQPPHLQLGEQHTPQQRGPSPALQAHRQQIHDAPVPCNTMQLQQRQNEGKVVNELQDTKHTIKHAHIQTMHISLLGLRKDLMAGVQPSKKNGGERHARTWNKCSLHGAGECSGPTICGKPTGNAQQQRHPCSSCTEPLPSQPPNAEISNSNHHS